VLSASENREFLKQLQNTRMNDYQLASAIRGAGFCAQGRSPAPAGGHQRLLAAGLAAISGLPRLSTQPIKGD
jgi:hypothetical protein